MSKGPGNHNSLRGRFLVTSLLVGVLFVAASIAVAQETVGTLATSVGDSITDNQLSSWIDEFIPPNSKRLVVLTECYGGDKVDNFAGKSNTTVISATSPGETSTYGGYDDDAASALKPDGGSATNVHGAGFGDAQATPITGGGLAPSDFSLESISLFPPSEVLSRHVLVYAGQPGGGGGTTDAGQRDTIANNFAGETNTTVTSVGGAGGNGWDHPGSASGLRSALDQIGRDIRNSPFPEREQFILYVTDHGDLHKQKTTAVTVQGGGIPQPAVSNFQGFVEPIVPDLLEDPLNEMSFSIFIDMFEQGIQIPSDIPEFFHPGDWLAELTVTEGPNEGQLFAVDSFFDVFVELSLEGSEPGFIGDQPGEGVRVVFPVEEHFMIDSFFDVTFDVNLINHTPDAWLVSDFRQDTGAMSKRVLPFLPGDFDANGVVDGDDFLIWQSNFGGPGPDGDADFDGDVDGDDFLIWQSNFGSGNAAGAAVPEPGSLALALFAVASILGIFRRKR